MAIDLGDYVTVAERISVFRAKHPDGSLQPLDLAKPYEIVTIGDRTFIVCAVAAYRAPDDPRPGVGIAWEPFPGRTPYTKDSELMNASTSAQGRAIVAALGADTQKGVASAEEIRNRQSEAPSRPVESPAVVSAKRVLWAAAQDLGWSAPKLADSYAAAHGGEVLRDATAEDLLAYAATLGDEPA